MRCYQKIRTSPRPRTNHRPPAVILSEVTSVASDRISSQKIGNFINFFLCQKEKSLQKRSWQPCGLTAVGCGSISSKSQKLFAEALGNPRNYPLDERVFAAFGYLSDFLRVGALRFARWCAYGAASPPIGLLLSHRALFRIFPRPSEPPIPYEQTEISYADGTKIIPPSSPPR